MQIHTTELHAVRAFAADRARRCGVTAEALHNLPVAVTEVATHAIRHGDAAHLARQRPDLRDRRIRPLAARGVHQLEPAGVRRGLRVRPVGAGMLCDTVQVADRGEGYDGAPADVHLTNADARLAAAGHAAGGRPAFTM
jgi:hypothetical protein